MKHTTPRLLCWVRTPYDSRDTAGGTADLPIPPGITPLAYARGIVGGDITPPKVENGRIVPGHSATIAYPSGKLRTVTRRDC